MNKVEILILYVQKFSNEELVDVLREIDLKDGVSLKTQLSPNADKLFKIYNNDHWTIGMDRFNEIIRCIEQEIIRRLKYNKNIFLCQEK
jgi:excinuclease UvrABC helicase subunit UvrB